MNNGTRKHLPVLIFAGVLIAGMTTLVSYAPTLYRLFCAATGYGGAITRANAPADTLASNVKVTVHFDANVSSELPWEFRPLKNKVEVRVGEPTRAYYYARNNSDKTIVARATFNVSPYKVAPYFFKIQCFCFTNERLGPHESAKLPLLFYIDKQFLKDDEANEVKDFTLSYTFFEQDGLSTKEVAAARNLKTGSKEEETQLKQAKSLTFDNDAPRR
jgi:cytochrome c oxidase assembly protein subunit 11